LCWVDGDMAMPLLIRGKTRRVQAAQGSPGWQRAVLDACICRLCCLISAQCRVTRRNTHATHHGATPEPGVCERAIYSRSSTPPNTSHSSPPSLPAPRPRATQQASERARSSDRRVSSSSQPGNQACATSSRSRRSPGSAAPCGGGAPAAPGPRRCRRGTWRCAPRAHGSWCG
jgi:hypothetical protein